MSVAIEREFLKRVLESSDNINQAIKFRVSKDLIIDSINKKLYEITTWFFHKYGSLLSADSLNIILGKSKLREDVKQKVSFLFTELQSTTFENRSIIFLIDSLRDDFKKQQLKDLLISSVNNFEAAKIDEAITDLKTGIIKIELNSRSETREGFIHDSADERGKKYYDVKEHPEKYRGISTGWPSFDRITGGIRGGQLMVIIGMIKSGKSCALLNIGYHASAIEHKNVLFVSVEMKKDQLERRYDARDSGLSYSKIRDGRLNLEEEEIYNKVREAQKVRPGKFYILDEAMCSVSFIKSKLSTLPFKTDLLIIDYLSILQPTVPTKDLWRMIGDLTVEVRDIARELNIPVVTAAQANREGLKEARYKFGIENVGLSHLISAHADTLLSLRLADPDELEVNDVVEMNAATIAIRDDRGCRFTIDACFDRMLLKERNLVLSSSMTQPFPSVPGVTTHNVP